MDLRDRESRSFELYCAAPIDRDRISILDSGKRKFPGRDFGRREPRIAGFSEKNELADQTHSAEAAEIVEFFNTPETSGNPQDWPVELRGFEINAPTFGRASVSTPQLAFIRNISAKTPETNVHSLTAVSAIYNSWQ